MDLDEALHLLELTSTATAQQIEAAYVDRRKVVHPDVGGSADAFIKLELAKEVALASLSQPNMAVAPLHPSSDLVALIQTEMRQGAEQRTATLRAQAAREKVERVTTSIVVQNTSRQLRMARTASLIAAASIGYASLTLTGRVPDFPGSGWLTAILAIILGVWAWAANQAAHDLKEGIDYLSETLTDKAEYLDLVTDIVSYKQVPINRQQHGRQLDFLSDYREWLIEAELSHESWENWEREYEKSGPLVRMARRIRKRQRLVRAWYTLSKPFRFVSRHLLGQVLYEPHQLARAIGYRDFRRLLISIGLEHEMLEAQHFRPEYGEGRPFIVYVVKPEILQIPEQRDLA